MAVNTTGKKYFNMNKNLESHEVWYYSNFYKHSRNSSEVSTVSKSYGKESYVNDLKEILNIKENRIDELKKLLEKPKEQPESKVPKFQEVFNTSMLDPERSVKLQKSHINELELQVLERKKQKMLEMISNENDLKNRMKELEIEREIEMEKRLLKLQKAQEYRKELEVQEQLSNQIYLSQRLEEKSLNSSRNFSLPRIVNKNSASLNIPTLTRDQIFPKSKNLNRVAVELSNLEAFKQPLYTKHSPKIVSSFPIIGTKSYAGLNWKDPLVKS